MLAIHKAVFILLFAGLMFIPDVAPVLAEVRDDPLSEFIKKKIQKKKIARECQEARTSA